MGASLRTCKQTSSAWNGNTGHYQSMPSASKVMTMLELIWQQQLLKLFENRNVSFSPTQHTVQISPQQVTILCKCLQMCYVNADLQTMKRLRMWCICV